MHYTDFLSADNLAAHVDAGHISARPHPEAPDLRIYNYTPRCQYESLWTPETMACRGLILDGDGFVVARPFPKFFNLSQHSPESSTLPPVPLGAEFEAYEKLDGSLGISYPFEGEVRIATRGSFDSDQARWATRWWRSHGVPIPSGQTWLFEIIYPQNRIVVDYGDRAELVLLAVIDIATGADLPLPEWPGSTARRFSPDSVEHLVRLFAGQTNFEGFVIRYPSTGQRVKVKLDEYVRLHRILTSCSSRTIWELLAAGGSLDEVLDRVPDEFYAWVRAQERGLLTAYDDVMASARESLADPLVNPADRKATAEYFKSRPYTPVLFKLLDGKDPADLIWKMLRPEYSRPFVMDEP